MDFWKTPEEVLKKIDEDRKRLLAYSDAEAESLPIPDRYQRMRYLREIEAAEWLAQIRREMPVATQETKPIRKKYRAPPTGYWNN